MIVLLKLSINTQLEIGMPNTEPSQMTITKSMTVFIDVVDNDSVDDELFNEKLPIRL